MVRIRLRRMGNKHRPFYRIIVTKSASPRSGAHIEILGTYNSLTRPSTVTLNGERALHWLMEGAQPTETVAYLLKREGVLEQFFAKRPKAKASYKFLDKRTAAMSQGSAMDEKPAKTEEAPVEAPAEVAAEGSEA